METCHSMSRLDLTNVERGEGGEVSPRRGEQTHEGWRKGTRCLHQGWRVGGVGRLTKSEAQPRGKIPPFTSFPGKPSLLVSLHLFFSQHAFCPPFWFGKLNNEVQYCDRNYVCLLSKVMVLCSLKWHHNLNLKICFTEYVTVFRYA